ncbi:hypothetical protein ABER68_24875 [Paenibacillus alvei]
MAAYYMIHGDYCSENKKLITEVLKKKWGFDGFFIWEFE